MTLFDGLFYFSPVSLACLWLLVYLFEWDALDAELQIQGGASMMTRPGDDARRPPNYQMMRTRPTLADASGKLL